MSDAPINIGSIKHLHGHHMSTANMPVYVEDVTVLPSGSCTRIEFFCADGEVHPLELPPRLVAKLKRELREDEMPCTQ